jgi:hypothetical protein
MRCYVDTVGIAVIQLIIDGIGAGFAFLALSPLLGRLGGERGLSGWLLRSGGRRNWILGRRLGWGIRLRAFLEVYQCEKMMV